VLLTELLAKARRLYPNKEAIVCGGRRWTYADFGDRVDRFSAALTSLGVQKGDRVAILHRNCHRYLETYFAAAQMGAALIPINYRLSPRDWVYTVEDSGSSVILVEDQFGEAWQSVADSTSDAPETVWCPGREGADGLLGYEALLASSDSDPRSTVSIDEHDMAQIYYTSGTTGQGKGVVLSHRNVYLHALGTIAEFKLDSGDVWLHAGPMFHLADGWAVWSITWVGGVHVVIPEFEEHAVLHAFEDEGVTVTSLIPTMLNALVNFPKVDEYDVSSLRLLLSGGSPIAPALVKQTLDTFQCEFAQCYGLTETSPYVTVSLLKDHLRDLALDERIRYLSSAGREFITAEVRVVDGEGRDVRTDGQQVGEVIVRGDTVTKEYWNLPELTREAFGDDWLYTGDLAVIDEEGYLTIVDRKRDVIVSGGEAVYSVLVENELYSHPAVLEAVVIGVPDAELGQAAKAVVVLKEGRDATEEEIIQFCRERLPHTQAPRSVDFLRSLPKTGSAKIAKVPLRDEYWKDRPGSS
jgi:fatty-acyl-CoA synthase